jgi:lysozyme
MDDAATKAMIARHEGIRLTPYKDSLGLWTVGVGHLIGDGKSLPDSWNRQFSKEEVMALFDKDYEHHKAAAESNTPQFDSMSGSMKSAFVDLAFNMGPSWMSKWPTLRKQLNAKDAAGAADNLANSKWAGQVGNRAPTIVGLVNSGFQAADGGVFDGPKSGYTATLHGNEAVIPLKDGAVPVSMSQEFNMTAANLGELVAIMKSNVDMQNQMLAVLDEMRRNQITMTDNTGKMVAYASN